MPSSVKKTQKRKVTLKKDLKSVKSEKGMESEKNQEKCETLLCKEKTKTTIKWFNEIAKKGVKSLKQKMKNEGPKMKKEDHDHIKKTLAQLQKPIEKSIEKQLHDACISNYCNPGCKETIFEDGGPELPKELIQKMAKSTDSNKTMTRKNKEKVKKMVLTMAKDMRKTMFKGRKTVLKDNFYYKLTPKEVKEVKAKGALSACTLAVI
jgi:hypothetical protein